MKQVRPKKNLGQHFLTDLNIAKAIADTVDACPDLPILEVGPGMGVMTQYLVEKPRPFKVVEIDHISRNLRGARSEERGTRKEERGTSFLAKSSPPIFSAWICGRSSTVNSLC